MIWKLITLAALLLLARSCHSRQQQVALGEHINSYPGYSCYLLSRFFPQNQVHFPFSTDYNQSQAAYWSLQQSTLAPTCRFTPHGDQDVQLVLNHLVLTNTSFAVASGSHSSNTGASNIDAGATIDLSRLDEVTVVDDGSAVWLGPGARWSDVYAELEKFGLTVSGGRVGHVGVGGYVLGVGFSWFANEFGWTCDQVLEFEIVTPMRQILIASQTEHEDLFWALKGSLGAFGVVTRIKLPTLGAQAVYGGAVTYRQNEIDNVFTALQELTINAKEDLHSQAYVSFGYSHERHVYSAYLMNTVGEVSPAAFANLTSVPHLGSSLRNMTLKESADEIAESNPLGFRRTKFTLTARATIGAMHIVHDAYLRVAGATGFRSEDMLGVTIQPLTLPHLQKGQNTFSLGDEDGPLLLLSAEVWWSDEQQDQEYEDAARGLHDTWAAELMAGGLLHLWLYPNYAAAWQEPFEEPSVPEGVRLALESVRRTYDSDDVWRQLNPGSWHS